MCRVMHPVVKPRRSVDRNRVSVRRKGKVLRAFVCPSCGGRNVRVTYVDGLLRGHCEDCECRGRMVIERTFVVEDGGTAKEVHLPSRAG